MQENVASYGQYAGCTPAARSAARWPSSCARMRIFMRSSGVSFAFVPAPAAVVVEVVVAAAAAADVWLVVVAMAADGEEKWRT